MRILLTTLHAKYSHASLALPYLAAFSAGLNDVETIIREYTVNEPHEQNLRRIMSECCPVIAFSCYIWNIGQTMRLASDIKKIMPETIIILGGPEASYGAFELMQQNSAIDFIISGEGEATFRALLQHLQARSPKGDNLAELHEIPALFFREGSDIATGPHQKEYMQLESIPSPFSAGLVDTGKPLIYYETSRGCPFSCAFCLSSREGKVRSFSMQRIQEDLTWLMGHGIRQIKLVDRTFNYDAARANQIWQFILEHNKTSHFHFEIAADLLTDDNLTLLARVPADTFRFEIGIQSTSDETLSSVQRKANLEQIYRNVRRLRSETTIELHLDLVAGLPHEDYQGLIRSLDTVASLNPQVIQIEPLKLLKGAPMRRIAEEFRYAYADAPPYTILGTPWLSFEEIGRIETVGRLLDLFHNEGGFQHALAITARYHSLAGLMDRIAAMTTPEELLGRNRKRLYELFAQLTGKIVPQETLEELHDALFYDYCLQEMPLMGKLPEFIVNRQELCSWPGKGDLPKGIELPQNSRIKLFRFRFRHNYLESTETDKNGEISFVYISGAGQGLKIMAL